MIVMMVANIALLDISMPVREHHFPHAVAGAFLMGVRRRRRQDAKVRKREGQKPCKEAVEHKHSRLGYQPILTAI